MAHPKYWFFLAQTVRRFAWDSNNSWQPGKPSLSFTRFEANGAKKHTECFTRALAALNFRRGPLISWSWATSSGASTLAAVTFSLPAPGPATPLARERRSCPGTPTKRQGRSARNAGMALLRSSPEKLNGSAITRLTHSARNDPQIARDCQVSRGLQTQD